MPPTLEQVEYLLKHGAAWVLTHPLVWSVVREYWSPYHLNEERQAGRLRLAAALVEGLSEGTHAVTAVKPRPAAPGRAPTLFPKLGETHGWWNSEEGDADFSDASRFRRLYDTLMAALRSAVAWRSVAGRYRRFVDRLQHPKARAMLATDVVPALGPAFEKYMIEQGLRQSFPSLAQFYGPYEEWARLKPTQFLLLTAAEWMDLLVRAFDEGRDNPRHYVACELMTLIRFVRRNGREMEERTRSLVESTLRTIDRRPPFREVREALASLKAGAPRKRNSTP